MFGVTLNERSEVIPYARKLQERGARNVLVSLAGNGAILISEKGEVFESPAPKGRLVNAVGAGDSMVAGFLAGWLESVDYGKAFRMGVAAGSASAFSELFATREQVNELLNQI
jgi:1-phosphofructokinase